MALEKCHKDEIKFLKENWFPVIGIFHHLDDNSVIGLNTWIKVPEEYIKSHRHVSSTFTEFAHTVFQFISFELLFFIL